MSAHNNLLYGFIDFPILNIQSYVVISVWLLSQIMFSKFIHVLACISTSFFMAE